MARSFRTIELIVALSSLRYLPSIFFLFPKTQLQQCYKASSRPSCIFYKQKNATESIRPFYLIFRYLSHVPFVLSSFLYGVPELKSKVSKWIFDEPNQTCPCQTFSFISLFSAISIDGQQSSLLKRAGFVLTPRKIDLGELSISTSIFSL